MALASCDPYGVTPPAKEPSPYADVTLRVGGNGLPFEKEREYYSLDEGIQYLPVDVFRSLKRPLAQGQGISLGLYAQYLLEKPERLGLYPSLPGSDPVAEEVRLPPLPLGITRSTSPRTLRNGTLDYVAMAGINCATCHTGLLVHTAADGKRQGFLFDGAPSTFTIGNLISEMTLSIASTILNPKAFDDFYGDYQRSARASWALAKRGSAPELSIADAKRHHDRLDRLRKTDKWKSFHSRVAASSGDLHVLRQATIDYATKDLDSDLETLGREEGGPLLSRAPRAESSLGDAYPSYDDLNSPLKMYVYLVKRLLHFLSAASYAGGSADTGFARADPWISTMNMLAANGSHLPLGRPKPASCNGLAPMSDIPASDWTDRYDPTGATGASYIWNFYNQKWVFWGGVTDSMMERNLAQGIALLADYDFTTQETTLSVTNLQSLMANYARKIDVPRWPAEFGAIDPVLAKEGKALFAQHCLECHHPLKGVPGPGGTPNRYIDVRTDPWYYQQMAPSFYGNDLFSGVLKCWMDAVRDQAFQNESVNPANQKAWQEGREDATWRAPGCNALTAKSLYGVWATAPYLHNGSVPTIADLLEPPAKRPPKFSVGNLEYDTAHLGFVSDLGRAPYYATVFDTHTQGNGNGGHDFGTALATREKEAILEFLKAYYPEDPDYDLVYSKPDAACPCSGSGQKVDPAVAAPASSATVVPSPPTPPTPLSSPPR
jgi:mono/diheme cytochrome c family protein